MTIEIRSGYIPTSKRLIENPTAEQLRELTARMPNARLTSFDNYNVQTRVDSRSTKNTYIVTDRPQEHTAQTVTSEEGRKWARLQDEYIRGQEMVLLDGVIGNDPAFLTPARLIIEARNANVAGMQRHLYYPPARGQQPEVTMIITPNLLAAGYPNDRLILVDLDAGITRVFNSDYFGESKKGGLRMWNKKVYDAGGLAMHAGCKVIPVARQERVVLIVGLSGTGKTTTTFTRQNNSKPVQDDFIALMPEGKIYGTENGCFAKTFALDAKHEPTIYGAVTKPEAYLENVSQKERGGPVDFFDASYTRMAEQPLSSRRWAGSRTPAISGPPTSFSSSIAMKTSSPAWRGSTLRMRRPTSCWARPRALQPAERMRWARLCACRARIPFFRCGTSSRETASWSCIDPGRSRST